MRKLLLVSAAMLGIAAGTTHATGVVPSARVATGGATTTHTTIDPNAGITEGQAGIVPARSTTKSPAAPTNGVLILTELRKVRCRFVEDGAIGSEGRHLL